MARCITCALLFREKQDEFVSKVGGSDIAEAFHHAIYIDLRSKDAFPLFVAYCFGQEPQFVRQIGTEVDCRTDAFGEEHDCRFHQISSGHMSQNQAIANYQHMRFIMNIPSNNINIVGNRGIVNINSTLEKVAQSIEGTSSISAEKRQKLLTLFEQLRIILVNTPASHAEDAGVVADQAKEISEELMRPQLRASMLKIKGTGLIEAAKTIAIVLPAAIGVAKQIAEFISNLPG